MMMMMMMMLGILASRQCPKIRPLRLKRTPLLWRKCGHVVGPKLEEDVIELLKSLAHLRNAPKFSVNGEAAGGGKASSRPYWEGLA